MRHFGFAVDCRAQQRVEETQPTGQRRKSGRPKRFLDAKLGQITRGESPGRQLGSIAEENCCEAGDLIKNPTLNTNSVGFKAEADVDCLSCKKKRTHDHIEAVIDEFVSVEAATAECSPEGPTWADVGVDVSGGNDPFHADWAFWK
jgi:hypothetical protein